MKGDGGPAYPRSGYYPDTDGYGGDALLERLPTVTEPESGVSTRDYFAAKAIIGLSLGFGGIVRYGTPEEITKWVEVYAATAYRLADAMLQQRRTPPVEKEVGGDSDRD